MISIAIGKKDYGNRKKKLAIRKRKLKIALIGDLFVKNELLKNSLSKHLKFISDLNFSSLSLNWPEEPLNEGKEITEYGGSEEQVKKIAKEAEVLVTQIAPVTANVIRHCPQLKIIGCCRGGPVNINVKAATKRAIPVVNAPGRNAIAVTEFTLGIILAELKNIARSYSDLKRGIWRSSFYSYKRAGEELYGKKIGIIGFGFIGSKLATFLKPLGMQVLVYDPFVPEGKIKKAGVKPVNLNTLLKESDIITLHCRLNSKTRKMIGEKEFKKMKTGAYFINSARGELIDYKALYQALKEKKLAGAALDTFDKEPLSPHSPLLKLNNVTLTPHLAGSSRQTAQRSAEMIAKDISRYFKGKTPLHCINPEVLKMKK